MKVKEDRKKHPIFNRKFIAKERNAYTMKKQCLPLKRKRENPEMMHELFDNDDQEGLEDYDYDMARDMQASTNDRQLELFDKDGLVASV